MATKIPDFKEWKKQNSDILSTKFHRKYGTQFQEYDDFCEAEYAKAQRRLEPSPARHGEGYQP